MGIRVTGISTPVGGLSWEYTKSEKQNIPLMISPGQKIKVFISSICGVEKYDKVRADLKSAIESTQLADVYTFESNGASTLPAGDHYILALEDSDICIFLIDNEDGITPGVQKEIDTVKKHNIKALYYFCDEIQKEKTALEQSLMGAHFAKSKVVHRFEELVQDGAQALIDDIIAIYHYYCTGRIVLNSGENDEVQAVDVVGTEKYQLPTIPKSTLKNVDKCRDYLLKFVLGYSRGRYTGETEKTSEFDEWGIQFLPILFEGRSIKHFNIAMYLDALKTQQDEDHYRVVQIRWQAIQAYFAGDIEKCIEYLETALNCAKETNQPTWVIKDILVDLRNQHWTRCIVRNECSDPPAQKELTESSEELYYPILDRIHESLHEKYIEGLYKKKTGSPYAVTIGNNLDQYGEMLASSLIVSMYNGSLTHILLIYEKIRDFVFYLSCKYDDWNLRLNLYKLAIFAGKEKEIKGIQDSYPEVLNNLNADEAASIMDFCLNYPIKHQRLSSQLLSFGSVGYFLDDKRYDYYEKSIVAEIKSWLSSDTSVVSVGQNIFKCLSGVAYRMSQDTLSEICCQFIERHYSRWYMDMFEFIANCIDLRKMSNDSAKALIEHINRVLDSEEERKQINYSPFFLCVLRKQNRTFTEEMDKKIAEYLPNYYGDIYKLETTEDEKQDMPVFVREYVDRIRKNNEVQGKDGVYFGHGTCEIATVRAILLGKEYICDADIMDTLVSVVTDTLLISKEDISTKLDAIALLIYIAIKYPEDYTRNKDVYEKLFEQQKAIEVAENSIISSNIDSISLKIGLQLLYISMGKDVYTDILELMPYIQDDVATTIAVTQLIIKYLENSDDVMLPARVEAIILQNVLQWLRSEYTDIRWNATRILLTMSRNPENCGIVNHQLVNLIDSNSVYIKNLIMRHLHKIKGITDGTKEYVMSKCKHDANFVVRMVCDEVEKGVNEE
ncbi:DUF6650 family protein [Dorea sp. AM58-8]|uniref:DUF6650 family protein n=1 Tax=Dorea sp. AM58-8 TaxID=2292346 RepID=UPI000E544F3C|nr:DUF6650 family protein [Dorea sp. AM58-8]RGY83148.1 hypothetical protein DXA18_00240 [Dorea sp. AM58-8]